MTNELKDTITPISSQDMVYNLANAWNYLYNEIPKKESITVLLSQSSLECGQGYKFCHNYNYGNAKSIDGDGFDYVFYKCNEILKVNVAKALLTTMDKDGGTATITGVRSDGLCNVDFYPKHKYCRFRAFNSAQEGAVYYLGMLHNRFKYAWPAVLNGDPASFVHSLKKMGYFTADEAPYTKAVVSLFNQFQKLEFDPDKIGLFTEQAKQNILNLVTLTTTTFAEDEIANNKSTDNS